MLFAALTINGIQAQTKQAATESYSGTVTGMSFKNAKQAQASKTRAEDIVWKRDVYRMVDLQISENASLYYPIEASKDRKNLFSTIFDAIAQNKIKAYEWLDGREVFTDDYVVKFKDILKQQDIPFTEKTDPRKPGTTIFDIDAIDIPTSEVTLLYVKEVMYLDQRNASLQTRMVALCPVLIRADEYGGNQRIPMFWIPIEALKTILSEQSIAADTLNSAERISMYDYFNQRRYKGDIYKVSNLKNQTIFDYCKTPEEIKAEQKRLEKELKEIGNSLWEPNQKELRDAKNAADKQKKGNAKKKHVEKSIETAPVETPVKETIKTQPTDTPAEGTTEGKQEADSEVITE